MLLCTDKDWVLPFDKNVKLRYDYTQSHVLFRTYKDWPLPCGKDVKLRDDCTWNKFVVVSDTDVLSLFDCFDVLSMRCVGPYAVLVHLKQRQDRLRPISRLV